MPKRRALIVATVASHIRAFHIPYINWLKQHGWDVDVATDGKVSIPEADREFALPFSRTPRHPGNFRAYFALREIMGNGEYDLVHCHTPIAAAITRVAARKARKRGTQVAYTAHGFHFYDGAPLKNWLLYYPVERFLARWTDDLLTINREDFERATKSFHTRVHLIPGVGVDINRFNPSDVMGHRDAVREELGIDTEAVVAIYTASFDSRKDHETLLHAWSGAGLLPNARLLLAGRGPNLDESRELARQLGIEDTVRFLGYRDDIDELLGGADFAISSSRQEGLPVNIIEAQVCGLPAIVTRVRGHVDLVQDGVNGLLVDVSEPEAMATAIQLLACDAALRKQLGVAAAESAQRFELDNCVRETVQVYENVNVTSRGLEDHAETDSRNSGDVESPTVSVVVPVYNILEFVRPCLESLEAQDYANLEIIAVDDGSTDGCHSVLQALAHEPNSRLKIVSQANQGLSAARNTGLSHSTGELLVFVDGDDIVSPSFVSILVQTMTNTDADVVSCGHKVLQPGETLPAMLTGSDIETHVYRGREPLISTLYGVHLPIHAWAKLARRDLWQKHPFPVGLYYEDLATIPRLVADVRTLVHIDAELYGFVTRPGSITRTVSVTEKHVYDLLTAIASAAAAVQDEEDSAVQKALLSRRSLELCRVAHLASLVEGDSVVEARDQAVREIRKILPKLLVAQRAPIEVKFRATLLGVSSRGYGILWRLKKRAEGWLV